MNCKQCHKSVDRDDPDCDCVRREAEAREMQGRCKACANYTGRRGFICNECVKTQDRIEWDLDPDLIECDRCRELFASRLDESIIAGYHCCPDCAE